ncbi:MAG: prolipoprotein diacylglyceryl transferase [Nitrospiraceae bacterium]|nr:prolipoprotein diacylglyceryl transferase [Nitrospiraceae bacterium]
MIQYTPQPVISFNDFSVHMHSLMLSLAMISVYAITLLRIKRNKLDFHFFTCLSVWVLAGAFIGARLLSVISQYGYYKDHLFEVISLQKGGRSIGGILGGLAAATLYSNIKKQNIWKYADQAAPGILIGIFIARIGCFLNWDDVGLPCNLAWCISVNNEPSRHPYQLYESVTGLFLSLFLFKLEQRKFFDGGVFLMFCVFYFPARFLLEFLRDSKRYFLDLTFSQITIGFLFIVVSGFFTFKKIRILSFFHSRKT